MTNDHDLSLLTDEERDKREMALKLMRDLGPMNMGIDAVDELRVMAFIADDAFTALIAARAENKRLRGGLLAIANADFGKVLELVGSPFIFSGDKYKSAEDFEIAGDYSTDARYIRPARERAISAAASTLLNSEKGGE